MLKSVASSRAHTPGTRTPQRGKGADASTSADDEYEIASPMVTQELQERLQQLAIGGEPGRKDNFLHSVEILEVDRRKTAILGREQALHDILNVVANKYEPAMVSTKLFQTVVTAFLTARSEMEAILSLQLVAVMFTFVLEETNTAQDECLDDTRRLLPVLLERAGQSADYSVGARAAMATCYAVLQYFLNSGGGGFGVDTIASDLLELAETTTHSEAIVTAAALSGVGLVVVLAHRNTARSLVADLMPALVQFLEMPQPEVKQAAAKLAGIFFEKTTKPSQFEGTDDVVQALEGLSNESAKRVAKKDKKSQKSVVRDVLRTYAQHERHDDPSNIIDEEERTLTHFRLSSHKSLRVSSWAVLIVIQHLKWVYGPGLHSQLANNPFAANLLRDLAEDGEHGSIDLSFDDDLVDNAVAADSEAPRARRAVDIRKARLEKVEARQLDA